MMASAALAAVLAPRMADFFIGAYTTPNGSRGISRARLNLETGEISSPTLAAEIENPSCLALHPSGKVLYAVKEFTGGDLAAFSVGPDLALTPLGGASFAGGGPCHISVTPDGKTLLAAAYGGGSLASFPLGPDGKIGAPVTTFQHQGRGLRDDRQKEPHMHWAGASPDGKEVAGVCLGTDQILSFSRDPETSILTPKTASLRKASPGAGPRHLAWAPNGKRSFTINELDLTLDSWQKSDKTGQWVKVQTLPLLDAKPSAGASGAAILIHPNGKWLYTTVRGVDKVSVFELGKGGRLTKKEEAAAGVVMPRGAALDPTGAWLLVAGQESGTLTSFRINPENGGLTATGHTAQVSRPTWIEFAKQP